MIEILNKVSDIVYALSGLIVVLASLSFFALLAWGIISSRRVDNKESLKKEIISGLKEDIEKDIYYKVLGKIGDEK